MALTIKEGNLWEAIERDQLDAIAHGVNCKGVMGAGIALQFADTFPKMLKQYKIECSRIDADKLVPGRFFVWYDEKSRLYVYNLATQNLPGADASYYAVTLSVHGMIRDAEATHLQRIGIPRIGSGIGGLEQNTVEACVRILAWTTDVELIMYDLPGQVKPGV